MVAAARWGVLALSIIPALISGWLFITLVGSDTLFGIDGLRLALTMLCVFWLTWGAASGLLGLLVLWRAQGPPPPMQHAYRTAILMPVYHEDPPTTFARIAAMSSGLERLGVHDAFDIFILSDSQALDAAAHETLWFERLLTDCSQREQIFYRRRELNVGRKAGNIEEFVARSGGAYEYALVLDADSLMDAGTIVAMVATMDASPRIGLLQSLPVIVNARSAFGRAMQFATHVYTPVYSRGAALLQGDEGPYWGHNAIFRVRAFAASCGLPVLSGKPPFGGYILSHDYVEAALLARNGWQVRMDPSLIGSFEECPENIIDYAKRDQRWCQGNLQHSKVLFAPRLPLWNRITLLQGILSYLMPPIWLLLLAVNLATTQQVRGGELQHGPDWAGWALIAYVAAVLLLPKIIIGTLFAVGRGAGFGAALLTFVSTLAEIGLSTLVAPIILMFQVRAVFRVISGFDGGWPPHNRADGKLSLAEATRGSWWVTLTGVVVIALVAALAPAGLVWALPIALPMVLAPAIIALTSLPLPPPLWAVPTETAPPAVIASWKAVLADWHRRTAARSPLAVEGAADVVG